MNLNPSDGHIMGYSTGWYGGLSIGNPETALNEDYLNEEIWNMKVERIAIVRHQNVWTSITAWKVSVFGGFLVCIFPVFGLNTERYVSLRSQSECEKNTDQKNSEYGHFSRFVCWYRKDNILFVLFVYTL